MFIELEQVCIGHHRDVQIESDLQCDWVEKVGDLNLKKVWREVYERQPAPGFTSWPHLVCG